MLKPFVMCCMYRGQEKAGTRNPVDLCVLVFRSMDNPNSIVGPLVGHSKRQVRSFIGCSIMMEPGDYTAVCLAFNHWATGMKKLLNNIKCGGGLGSSMW